MRFSAAFLHPCVRERKKGRERGGGGAGIVYVSVYENGVCGCSLVVHVSMVLVECVIYRLCSLQNVFSMERV
jgi:hypothetical protein